MLERYGVKTGVMPQQEGWRYEQPLPDGTTQRLPPKGCAGTDDALVHTVKMYRIQANIDLGDPAADVAEYIKHVSPINNRFPKRKSKVQPKAHESREPGFRPYLERIRDWMLLVGNKQVRLLLEDDADARAAICIKCPQNVPWKTHCLPCVENIESRAMNIRQRPSYKHDKDVGACRLHNFHISTAVFIDREDLPATNPNAPAECWMRKIA
jgi:hypothetical protein